MSKTLADLVDRFDKLTERIKEHRINVDDQIERQNQQMIRLLTSLREERDEEYEKEHKALVEYVTEFHDQLEEKERRLERAFKSVCGECADKIRRELY